MHKQLLAAAVLAAAATGAFAQQSPASAPQVTRPAGIATAPEHEPAVVTRAEFLAQASKRFDEMDANKDGKLTADERHAFHRARMKEMRAHGVEPRPQVQPLHEGHRPPQGPGPLDSPQPQGPKR